MIDIIYGENSTKKKEILSTLKENLKNIFNISVKDFVILVKNSPILLFPVFDLLRNIRNNTLGKYKRDFGLRCLDISSFFFICFFHTFLFVYVVVFFFILFHVFLSFFCSIECYKI